MAHSPASSDLSDPPSNADSDAEDRLSTAVPSSRLSVEPNEHPQPPPSKRRKTGNGPATSLLHTFDRAPSSQPAEDNDDIVSISSDGLSSAPGSPSQNEYALKEDAQTFCMWKDCDFGDGQNNDELVDHVQTTHCITGFGVPKKSKYVCEWGECQRKTSNHPSGYALKAHMRSHTKEKPYYCALPECDKAFTRSDALAKHMRTVHEPEPARPANDSAPLGTKKSSIKLKLSNGVVFNLSQSPSNSSATTPATKPASAAMPLPPDDTRPPPPTHDEDGNPIEPSPNEDNITYQPAYHPITGQPGFMITYPKDIHFTAWESAITADQLMRLLRRQVYWAKQEEKELQRECRALEQARRHEWELKEILLEGVLESELARADKEDLLQAVDERVRDAMQNDIQPSKALQWSQGIPAFRKARRVQDIVEADDTVVTTPADDEDEARSPSPPPTGHSGGGFDGDADPYDNYLAQRMAEYEERERLRSLHNTPQDVRTAIAAPPPGP